MTFSVAQRTFAAIIFFCSLLQISAQTSSPAKLTIDDPIHPVTVGLPASYQSPANEWYLWKPSPRLNKDVRVLLTLDPSNYPLGKKDIITEGDLPVVWTNTKYRMLYINMGHGPMIYGEPVQNRLFENAILWLKE